MKKILVVEDDRKIVMALAVRLRSAGFEVVMAYDAGTGIDAAVQHRPDLVLLDISLPDGTGFEVAEHMKSQMADRPPFFFLTASKQSEFRQRAVDLGAQGFFEKPFDANELLAAVRSIFQE